MRNKDITINNILDIVQEYMNRVQSQLNREGNTRFRDIYNTFEEILVDEDSYDSLEVADYEVIKEYVDYFFTSAGSNVVNYEEFLLSPLMQYLLDSTKKDVAQSQVLDIISRTSPFSFPPPPPGPLRASGGASPAGGGGTSHYPLLQDIVDESASPDKTDALSFLNSYNSENGLPTFDLNDPTKKDDAKSANAEKISRIEKSATHVCEFAKYMNINGPKKKTRNFLSDESDLEPFYDVDDNIELLGHAFKLYFDENSFDESEKQNFLKQYYLENEIYFQSTSNTSVAVNTNDYYESFEKLLNSIDDEINLVDFLVSVQPKTGLKLLPKFLDEAVRDTTTPIGTDHYLNAKNIGAVIDTYCSLKSPDSLKGMLSHNNFEAILETSENRKTVAAAFTGSIDKLSKLLGDDCKQVLDKVAEQLGDEAKTLRRKIDRKFLPEATAINAWGAQPDESRQDGRVSKEDTFKAESVKAESVGGEEFKFTDYSKLTIASIALTGLAVFGFVIASLATAGAALMPVMIGATVGSAVLGGGASVYLRSSDKSDFEKKQAEVAVAKDSAYQDHGQHPADLRKGPPYAERPENVRGSDRSNERGGRY